MAVHFQSDVRKNIFVSLARARTRDGNLSKVVLTELFVSGSGRETSSTFNFSPRDDLSITAVDRGATSGFHIVPNDSYPSGKFRSTIPPYPSPPSPSFTLLTKTKYEV